MLANENKRSVQSVDYKHLSYLNTYNVRLQGRYTYDTISKLKLYCLCVKHICISAIFLFCSNCTKMRKFNYCYDVCKNHTDTF